VSQSNYRVHHHAHLATSPSRTQLAVAILDVGNSELLEESLNWYTSSFNHALFVVTREGNNDIDALLDRYPSVRFLVFSRYASYGERINVVANECGANYFLVTRSDVLLVHFDGKALLDTQRTYVAWASVIANVHKEIVPSVRIPHLAEHGLDPQSAFPAMEEGQITRTLYPAMGLGLYNRALFQRLRGFDERISGEYHQLLDWGMRIALMGHQVVTGKALLMQYIERESIIEDRTEREGHLRCYTKALSFAKTRKGKIVLKRPKRQYFDREAWNVEVKHRLRWQVKSDLATLVSNWQEGQ
jgi:hypothetical protein